MQIAEKSEADNVDVVMKAEIHSTSNNFSEFFDDDVEEIDGDVLSETVESKKFITDETGWDLI